ncbi:MAG: hypothetical protein R6X33_11145 [Candidatus Brocadiia bacterium]
MSGTDTRGTVYRCPVCGAELVVLTGSAGNFAPRCCNRDMVRLASAVTFYFCPVCGAELAVLNESAGEFEPVCCNRPMIREMSRKATA